MENNLREYDRPIQIAEGIYWVGFYEENTNLHCNPYLIAEGDKAVLIDAGSRPDFATVMTKILQAGVDPDNIVTLIYHHTDPDLCGSMPNVVDLCKNKDLTILSEKQDNIFINYYIDRDKHKFLKTINDLNFFFEFNGRRLEFIRTPHAHCPGSFVTYDKRTKTLFSSDLFGSFSRQWELFTRLADQCPDCTDYDNCIASRPYCPLPDIIHFHRDIMPSGKSLRYAMRQISTLDIDRIAPQHGSVFDQKKDIYFLIEKLSTLDKVGIDAFDM
ncbi:MAG TPA: MBL fold metallo-hydrolase [Syntrophorhabdaceae bacterium]|nr:MBL fold metallo-hydrolase [Syntrophorhabdaceae bacterium]HQM82303.1 MBL fold metallo-hydrolase [Syntrophorhabdaceae bacterium]